MNASGEACQNGPSEAARWSLVTGFPNSSLTAGRSLRASMRPVFNGPVRSRRFASVLRRMAHAMVGREVSVSSGGGAIHGIVTNVSMEDGKPKVMIAGNGYSLTQVLSVAPADLSQGLP